MRFGTKQRRNVLSLLSALCNHVEVRQLVSPKLWTIIFATQMFFTNSMVDAGCSYQNTVLQCTVIRQQVASANNSRLLWLCNHIVFCRQNKGEFGAMWLLSCCCIRISTINCGCTFLSCCDCVLLQVNWDSTRIPTVAGTFSLGTLFLQWCLTKPESRAAERRKKCWTLSARTSKVDVGVHSLEWTLTTILASLVTRRVTRYWP